MKVLVVDGVRPFQRSPLDVHAEQFVTELRARGLGAELLRVPLLDQSAAAAESMRAGVSLSRVDEAAMVVGLRMPAPLLTTTTSAWWSWRVLDQSATLGPLFGCDPAAVPLLAGPHEGARPAWATSTSAVVALHRAERRSLLLRVPAPDPSEASEVPGHVIVDPTGADPSAVTAVLRAAASAGTPVVIEDRMLPIDARRRLRGSAGAEGVVWAADRFDARPVLGTAALMLSSDGDVEGSAAAIAAAAGRPVLAPRGGALGELDIVPTTAPSWKLDDSDEIAALLRLLTSDSLSLDGWGNHGREAYLSGVPSWSEAIERLCSSVLAVTGAGV
jgi:hypothetical protein